MFLFFFFKTVKYDKWLFREAKLSGSEMLTCSGITRNPGVAERTNSTKVTFGGIPPPGTQTCLRVGDGSETLSHLLTQPPSWLWGRMETG